MLTSDGAGAALEEGLEVVAGAVCAIEIAGAERATANRQLRIIVLGFLVVVVTQSSLFLHLHRFCLTDPSEGSTFR